VTTVEKIKAEIDKVPVEKLDGLYFYVRSLAEVRPTKHSRTKTIEKMKAIRIDGPADLATKLDDNLYGEKQIDK
jgi:hypothetical protein